MTLPAAADIRKRAEKILMDTQVLLPEELAAQTPGEVKLLLHELHVHQIELEMQNEELRRTQLALQDARARYFDLYNLAPVGYCSLDEKGLILEANLTASNMLGVMRSALNKLRFTYFIVPADEDLYYGQRKLLFEHNLPLDCELRLRRQNGTIFWGRLQASLAHESEGGGPIQFVTFSDISGRKQVELELLEARASLEEKVAERTAELKVVNSELNLAGRVKDEFLASVSHELRTPLTSILGLTEVLRLKAYGSLTIKQAMALENIETSGRQLLGMINAILDYSLVLTGQLDVRVAPCLLVDICQAALDETSVMAEKKQQHVSISFSELTTLVQMDERRLQQMLVYLLSNAIKFTPPGGSLGIDVKIDEIENLALVTVWDKGIGIQPEDLPRLFQGFAQLDSSLARQYGGAGLGLALVKKLAEVQGARIEVESIYGTGSWFTLSLPVYRVLD